MALEFFKILKESPEIFTANMYTQMGTCYLDQEEEVEAESCFQRAADMDQNNTEARGHLANLFRKQGKQKQALDMANHVVQLIQLQNVPRPKRRYGKYLRDPAPPLAAGPMAAAKPLMPLQPKPAAGEPREDTPSLGIGIGTGKIVAQPMAKPVLTPEDRLLAEAETSKLLATQYLILSRQRDRMRAGVFEGVRQWTKAARLLTNDFRSFKAFYPQDKSLKFSGYSSADVRQASTPLRDDMRAMASQLSQDIGAKVQDRSNRIPNGFGDTYRGMSFDAWLDIFMEFAICLAKRGKLKESYEMCQAAKDCVIFFHSRNDMFLLHLSWCMCAIMLNDYQTLMTIARFFLTDYQFTTDAYRMFTALARTCRGAVSWFNSGPTMKFILKQIKAMDYSITPASERTAEQDAERGLYTAVDQDGRLIINDDLDISLLMLYGYMLSLSENYLEALNYFMRAYALDPENPMISLSVGLTHIHHGLKSPSGIKNQNILQALTFLHQYYDIRKESEHLEERLEAHYNLGRAYQLLGLTHLAVPYYQQVLQENQDDVAEDVVMDTAFNLQNIYAIAGNMKLAMHITNKYLVI
ncbi:TPR-like protein [Glarea lozoyensis ATCC 20868]|uniref:TPR-like protein n=1 Tax=Glarea lozoyensis (strain ATCC 20868 / MF5171) TaxID=1116229 RepID=S3DVX3_GLAL2|nr:TPR-like protein [Glarea lozoyensis ATCC 20868]EPE36106.1 TPR-like protein [Glarea lozoyensis ATCC 20868]